MYSIGAGFIFSSWPESERERSASSHGRRRHSSGLFRIPTTDPFPHPSTPISHQKRSRLFNMCTECSGTFLGTARPCFGACKRNVPGHSIVPLLHSPARADSSGPSILFQGVYFLLFIRLQTAKIPQKWSLRVPAPHPPRSHRSRIHDSSVHDRTWLSAI